ncbi:MAG: heme exporter protein CcmD [Sagittula sp.]|jgi:heme exporter protein D|uniref:heme exporter protein CcmD n=1 Tax=unclassified Sagittula TaxID=2624628 RepID=UPI000C2D0578|nr:MULTISPECIES: heme exporter protein CcmD [unclassified Sagittula]AUC55026.1 heme exporter protein CcmD [Sagittula sp. P11]WHZ33581.1 heme exporter protein CcmD [Sagittula sp. MA-2]
MIPELGKYAGPVLASYAVSLALLGLLIVASVLRSRRVKRELEQVEGRKDG